MANDLIPAPSVELIRASNVPALLARIRPQWQAKSLIDRVRRLLDVEATIDLIDCLAKGTRMTDIKIRDNVDAKTTVDAYSVAIDGKRTSA